MRRNCIKKWLKKLAHLLFFLSFFAFAFEVNRFLRNVTIDPLKVGFENYARYQVLFDAWSAIALNLVALPLSLAAYFARTRVKSWFRPGRLRVDWRHLAVLVILPLFFIQRPPFIWMMTRHLAWFSLLVWYNLLNAFYKQPQSIQVELPDPEPPDAGE